MPSVRHLQKQVDVHHLPILLEDTRVPKNAHIVGELSHHLDRAIDFHGHNLRFSANKRPHSVNASRHGFHCVFLSEFQRLGVLSEPGHSADCKRVICLGDVQNVHQFVRRLRCQIGNTLGVSTALFVSKAYESAQIRKKGLGAVGIKLPRPIQID